MLGESIGCPAVLGAMIALSSLLLTGVLTWKDCLEYTPAWCVLCAALTPLFPRAAAPLAPP